jgi:hypothetical protein
MYYRTMGTPKILTFKNCVVRADVKLGYTETVFRDGSLVPAYPTGCDNQRQTSRRLGYGDDVAAMCREHEVLHTWLCERFDLPYSPTLWAVAHGQPAGCAPIWAQQEEEALVLSFQAYLNDRETDASKLQSLVDRGMSLTDLKTQATRLLRAA